MSGLHTHRGKLWIAGTHTVSNSSRGKVTEGMISVCAALESYIAVWEAGETDPNELKDTFSSFGEDVLLLIREFRKRIDENALLELDLAQATCSHEHKFEGTSICENCGKKV